MKWKVLASVILSGVLLLSACTSPADRASGNLSKDADNFQVYRRIVFVNGITDKYLLEIDGFCSLGNNDKDRELSVTCKVPGGFKKDFVGLSDNVTYTVEQLSAVNVSTGHYVVFFRPETIIPDVQSP